MNTLNPKFQWFSLLFHTEVTFYLIQKIAFIIYKKYYKTSNNKAYKLYEKAFEAWSVNFIYFPIMFSNVTTTMGWSRIMIEISSF